MISAAEVQVNFESTKVRAPLQLQGETALRFAEFSRPLRLYPPVPAFLVAVGGSVKEAATGAIQEERQIEVVGFSNGNKTSASFPVINNLRYEILTAINEDGTPLNKTPVLSIDQTTFGIRSDVAFTGDVRIEYNTQFKRLEYTPEFDSVGQTINFGTVYASYLGQTAKIVITPDDGPEKAAQSFTLYRVYKEYILEQGGQLWEYIPGWPENTVYSNGVQGPDPEEVNTNTYRLTMEKGNLLRNGRLGYAVDENPNENFQPFIGSRSYRPEYKVESRVSLLGTDAEWSELARAIDFKSINTRLRQRYGVALTND